MRVRRIVFARDECLTVTHTTENEGPAPFDADFHIDRTYQARDVVILAALGDDAVGFLIGENDAGEPVVAALYRDMKRTLRRRKEESLSAVEKRLYENGGALSSIEKELVELLARHCTIEQDESYHSLAREIMRCVGFSER